MQNSSKRDHISKMGIEKINQMQISNGGLKNLQSSQKYSKQTNCLTGQGNVIQDNIIVT